VTNATRGGGLGAVARTTLRWGFLTGVLPLSHTWPLADHVFEKAWFPAYLLFVFGVGALTLVATRQGAPNIGVAWVIHALGWGITGSLAQALERAGGDWPAAVAMALWAALGIYCVWCFGLSFEPRDAGEPATGET